MRLKEVHTQGLFGFFNHVVPLNMDERITIIHGPNGFGKTAILRLISGVFNARYSILKQLPFRSLHFVFDDGTALDLKKQFRLHNDQSRKPTAESISVHYGNKHFEFTRLAALDPRLVNSFDDYIPYLVRIGPEEWLYQQTGEILDADDVLYRFSDHIPHVDLNQKSPDWFTEITRSLSVHYIQAHRLEGRDQRKGSRADRDRAMRPVAAVTIYAAELAGRIQSTLATYADVSQSMDRSFPARLVNVTTAPELTMDELHKKLAALENKRAELTDAGLLDKEEYAHFYVPSTIDESKREVLSVYVSDAEKKLSVFDDLFARLNLFQTIINRRFLFKSMSISKQDGIVFRSKADNRVLPATSLSTGEQHEVVLLFELLFHVQPDALILIDEPEISLHVAWQQAFLKDLEQITALSRFDTLIATHSPQIISNRWDLTVELQGPPELTEP